MGHVPKELVRSVDEAIALASSARLSDAAALLKIAKLELLIRRHAISEDELEVVLSIAKHDLVTRAHNGKKAARAKRKSGRTGPDAERSLPAHPGKCDKRR